jgi:hypothetical protein
MMMRPGTPRSQSAIGTTSLSFQVRATANSGLDRNRAREAVASDPAVAGRSSHLTGVRAAVKPSKRRKP